VQCGGTSETNRGETCSSVVCPRCLGWVAGVFSLTAGFASCLLWSLSSGVNTRGSSGSCFCLSLTLWEGGWLAGGIADAIVKDNSANWLHHSTRL